MDAAGACRCGESPGIQGWVGTEAGVVRQIDVEAVAGAGAGAGAWTGAGAGAGAGAQILRLSCPEFFRVW